MDHGVIEQDGTPEEVVEHPATPFVADFLGSVNVFHGRLEDGKARFGRWSRLCRRQPAGDGRRLRAAA